MKRDQDQKEKEYRDALKAAALAKAVPVVAAVAEPVSEEVATEAVEAKKDK